MDEINQPEENNLTFQTVLLRAMGIPGVKIDRKKFLRKELIRYYPENVIEDAIRYNPAKAGIPRAKIDEISKQVINYETSKITSISVAASLPGGVMAVGAATADIVSYYGFILRVLQELAYLYGYGQFNLDENDLDSETMNIVLVFIGVMFGVQGAAEALRDFANILAKQVAKKLAQRALTLGTIYPIVKRVATSVGIHMTKQIFADTVASAIPVISGGLSGGLTFVMFRPLCMRLRKNLASSNLCDPNFYIAMGKIEKVEEIEDIEAIEEVEDIEANIEE